MTLSVLCITSDNYLWALRPFLYLFDTYWSTLQSVSILGCSRPDFPLQANHTFYSRGPADCPAQSWSDMLIAHLSEAEDDHVLIMLDDYWLTRTVDVGGIRTLHEYCHSEPRTLRMDLTNDRLHANGDARNALDYGSYGHYDLIRTVKETQYNMSLQAGIWSVRLLLGLLKPGLTPWETEIYTSIPNDEDYLVLGTRQWPVRYANVMLKGAFQHGEFSRVPKEHRDVIERQGWLKNVG